MTPPPADMALLTTAEVAHLFRVGPKTVGRWASAGRLSSIRTLGGHRRYRESEVRALLAAPTAARARVDRMRDVQPGQRIRLDGVVVLVSEVEDLEQRGFMRRFHLGVGGRSVVVHGNTVVEIVPDAGVR